MDSAFADFLNEVEHKREEIRCSRSGAFYRGHTRAHHVLVPSLLRSAIDSEAEHNIYHECYARASTMFSRGSWEALSLLQHYGIPTRLLDWTDSLAVALFFALGIDVQLPHIWIVNAFRLNQDNDVSKRCRIIVTGLDSIPDYFESFIRLENPLKWPYRRPIFLQIPWTSDRIRAQSGYFSVHTDAEPLEKASPRWIRRVDIPMEALPGARRFLESAGITEHVVFPDFVGLASFLKRRYVR